MGAGIAQLAGLGGYATYLYDPDRAALDRGLERLERDLGRGVERNRWSETEAEAASSRVGGVTDLEALSECDLVIEAAPESLNLKRDLFGRLEALCAPEAVLATNTSSLPVGEIAAEAARPERICGMHFFNPPALMRLVEIVAAEATAEPALADAEEVGRKMGRTPVRCTDSPGFIVNRCNRPFALESLRMLEQGLATATEIDLVLREDGGYPMGPFELMDLIGIDVNLEVARSFHRQRPLARWEPSPISERMVAEGRLGRKSGAGFYEYGDRAAERDAGQPDPAPALRRTILDRVVAQLVNEACFAVEEGVAGPDDVDTAMKLGLNHPRGPFEWARELGPQRVLGTLEALASEISADRYGPAALLREWAAAGGGEPPA